MNKLSTQRTPGGRQLTVRLQTARGRKISSQRWLQRQLNDPYISQAKSLGYRSRSALKLAELNQKHKFLTPGKKVVDLGAAPGGWTQVAVEAVGHSGKVLAIDINEMDPVAGAKTLCLDFMSPQAFDVLKHELSDARADVVLSDMAAPSIGHAQTDHLRIMILVEEAFAFALEVLAPNGVFVTKILQGGEEREFLQTLRKHFQKVKLVKPASSRKNSSEIYVLAQQFII